MFTLQTERLRLIPLSYTELEHKATDLSTFERHLGLVISHDTLDEHFQDVLTKYMLPRVQAHPHDYYWYTDWQIILNEENRLIGSFLFKGSPNEHGEVEVGYGIQPDYENKGYATEALRSATIWALNQPGCSQVVAETLKDNIPSIRVLEKIGFTLYNETDQFYYWRINRLP